jgi:hypothetical protein
MTALAEFHPSDLVRRLLRETGLSVTDAAERLKVSRSQLHRVLSGQSNISAGMALRLAAVFGVDARDCLDRQTEYDLARARRDEARSLKALKPYAGAGKRDPGRIVALLRERESELRRKGIDELQLFGSVARGEARADSDIDLAFRAATGRHFGLIELGRVSDRLSELLGAPVDLVPVGSLKPEVRERALEDSIRVF